MLYSLLMQIINKGKHLLTFCFSTADSRKANKANSGFIANKRSKGGNESQAAENIKA